MKIKNPIKLSEERLAKMEAQLGFSLPDDYREFLKNIGGGVVELDETNEMRVKSIDDIINLEVLFSNDLESESLNVDFWMERYRDEMPERSVLVGMQGLVKNFV